MLMIATLLMLLYKCDNNKKNSTVENEEVELSYDPMVEENKAEQERSKKAWEEAYEYTETITDTTFLKTRGTMSQLAIHPFKGDGYNEDYEFNNIVYMAALERAKKHLSVKDNQFVFNAKSGAEINITEDLYQFITDLFVDWNTWVKQGKLFKIIKTEEGYYDLGRINERVN